MTTGWMTARRNQGAPCRADRIDRGALLWRPLQILSLQAATGDAFLFKNAVAPHGPVLIAMYSVTAVLAIAALGDARVAIAGGIAGAARIARHLWRMCLGLTIAVGSAFTNWFRAVPARALSRAAGVFPAAFRSGRASGLLDDPRAADGLV